jgi:hypothetical protein
VVQNFAETPGAVHGEVVEARVVGGRVAALGAVVGLLVALLALTRTSPPSSTEAAPSLKEAQQRAPSSSSSEEPAPAPPADPLVVVAAPTPEPTPARVILVTLDGVRWEDVLQQPKAPNTPNTPELMPNLMRIVRERGVALGGPDCPNDMRASGPNFVSLPGYLEIFTGKSQEKTCMHNACPPVSSPTIIDDVRAASDRPGDVAVFSSWTKFGHAVARDRKNLTISTGAHMTLGSTSANAKSDNQLRFLLEVGQVNQGYPGHADYRPDEHTAKIALHYLESVGPRVMVVGLGDADEQAHRGDVAGYKRAIRKHDEFLGDLDRLLNTEVMGNEGKMTAVLVTTDHGRATSLRAHGASYPESGRVWFAAFGARIAHRGVSCAAAPLRLSHVAGAMRSLMAIDNDPKIDHGPLANEILEKEMPLNVQASAK